MEDKKVKELNTISLTDFTDIDKLGFMNTQQSNQAFIQVPLTDEPQQGTLNMVGRDVQVGNIVKFICDEVETKTPVKIYYPDGEGPFPVVMYIHGGGWITGWDFLDEGVCRMLCKNTNAAVISPTYQLAPQCKWPGALMELYYLLRHFINNAADYNLNSGKIALGGGSAGATLAMNLCELAYRRNEFKIDYGCFIYPSLDLSIQGYDKCDEKTNIVALAPEMVDTMINWYVPENVDLKNPLISPAYIPVDHLPPFTLVSGRNDVLNKETRAYIAKVMEAGHDMVFRCYENCAHGFLETPNNEEEMRDTVTILSTQLNRIFSK